MLAVSSGWGAEFGMTVINPAEFRHGSAKRDPYERVSFHRTELSVILSTYGKMVAAGEWRDYSMDFLRDAAVFSAFRRTSEIPLYRIEKRPRLAQKQGQWAVIGADGRILKRGRDLDPTLRVFDKVLIRAVD